MNPSVSAPNGARTPRDCGLPNPATPGTFCGSSARAAPETERTTAHATHPTHVAMLMTPSNNGPAEPTEVEFRYAKPHSACNIKLHRAKRSLFYKCAWVRLSRYSAVLPRSLTKLSRSHDCFAFLFITPVATRESDRGAARMSGLAFAAYPLRSAAPYSQRRGRERTRRACVPANLSRYRGTECHAVAVHPVRARLTKRASSRHYAAMQYASAVAPPGAAGQAASARRQSLQSRYCRRLDSTRMCRLGRPDRSQPWFRRRYRQPRSRFLPSSRLSPISGSHYDSACAHILS